MTPRQIVQELDRYIIGQDKAKKAVAIALRNRTRRQKLSPELRDEVYPKNIIMIGPTGVGKTEIARRLSKLAGAPFIKVEATKYTEVGYVGRDVESMVRDLMAAGVAMVKAELQESLTEEANLHTEDILLDLLLPGSRKPEVPSAPTTDTREKFREKLRSGEFEEKKVEIQVNSRGQAPALEVLSGSNMEEIDMNLGGALGNIFGQRKKKRTLSVKQAREAIFADELDKLVDMDQVVDLARDRVQNMGIIFIDEIDKIASRSGDGRGGADVSREGVQRDILPIVEGSKVNTKWGPIDTAHVLFIAAGAFHMSKPSDLIPELQGRFPIRVELEDLGQADFQRILTQPKNSLLLQYKELLKTEGVEVVFTDEGVQRIAEIAYEVNSRTENIGARRLHTVLELLLEDLSYTAPEIPGQTVTITPLYIDEKLGPVVQDQDLARYIL
ncbi:MAG: ATP-dependent protease ATPase subunit HslU [Spirochaetales bacterium]|nr:ATP-dependent protease ATPase subunit HslU [Spirochaetales bacterium]